MSNFHQTVVLGRIGRDPELKHMTSGDAVCNFSVAVSETWKSKSGEKQESTTWYRCDAFGKLAEIIAEYGVKGQQVFVTGKMVSRKYNNKDGQEVESWTLRVDEFKMLGSKQQKENQDADPPRKPAQKSAPKQDDFPDDDIPF